MCNQTSHIAYQSSVHKYYKYTKKANTDLNQNKLPLSSSKKFRITFLLNLDFFNCLLLSTDSCIPYSAALKYKTHKFHN